MVSVFISNDKVTLFFVSCKFSILVGKGNNPWNPKQPFVQGQSSFRSDIFVEKSTGGIANNFFAGSKLR